MTNLNRGLRLGRCRERLPRSHSEVIGILSLLARPELHKSHRSSQPLDDRFFGCETDTNFLWARALRTNRALFFDGGE
ncbi:hypothetical protein QFZ94_008079 [Paraburkholderia sp. JPY465]|uniref:hypothetical protein n=1 Tax=Paraburkholderia sp. JPY465 TaxID=3042285 RepID=UPI003D23AD24